MPNSRAFIATLIGALVVLSVIADQNRSAQHVLTGTVVESRAREWIAIVNDTTDPAGVQIVLRDTTTYERRERESVDPVVVKPGVRVTVWYRSVAERRPVADKVRVLIE